MRLDLTRAAELLERDVERTLGPGYGELIEGEMLAVAELARDDLAYALVENMQQLLHDEFIDTTWPACPQHSRHPLWYEDGAWWCTQDGVRIAPLGEVPAAPGSAA